MLKTTNTDKRALKLLSKYDTLAENYKRHRSRLKEYELKYLEEHAMTQEDLDYLKEQGLAFDCVDLKHDETLKRCFEYLGKLEKRRVTDSFLASFSSASLAHRSGLAAYAIMQSLPAHKYSETAAGNCGICSARAAETCVDITYLNHVRYSRGSLSMALTPYQLQFFLAQQANIEAVEPAPRDFEIFNLILGELGHAQEACKPNDMRKILKKMPGFGATLPQCTGLLETLGFCSILQSSEHKGYLDGYTNPGLAPHKSHTSNWPYPVDFWTGRDGVNKDALSFWFGEYKEIALG